jgi:hypothetical protein
VQARIAAEMQVTAALDAEWEFRRRVRFPADCLYQSGRKACVPGICHRVTW